MWLEMKVKQLALDPLSNMPMIILRDEDEKRSLPSGSAFPRPTPSRWSWRRSRRRGPMTHDLLKNVLESVGARVAKIVVNDLRDNTFYAVIHLRLGTTDLTVDSRPSDAIALALRVDAPIFVEEEVLTKAESVEVKVAKEPEGTGKTAPTTRRESRSGSSPSSRGTSTRSTAQGSRPPGRLGGCVSRSSPTTTCPSGAGSPPPWKPFAPVSRRLTIAPGCSRPPLIRP